MKCNLFGIKTEIGFLFTASIAFLLVFNVNDVIRLSVLFSLIHELGHLIAIMLCKEKPERISFGPFGMTIVRENDITQDYQKEFLTAIAGPVTNFLTALVFFLINTKYQNELLLKIIFVNLIIGSFNIMPVFALDGGRALESLLKLYFEEETSERILKTVSFVTLVIMMGFGFYILLSTTYNFTFLAISIYLTVMLFVKC